jgi:hypothetical protein
MPFLTRHLVTAQNAAIIKPEQHMGTTARNARQARLVARKKASGQRRIEGWLPEEVVEQLRVTYPSQMHRAPDWKRIAAAALAHAEQHQGEQPDSTN